MRDRIDAILQRAQAEYLDSLVPSRDVLLLEMERVAGEEGQPIADPEVAHFLRLLVGMTRPERVLEIGTNIGYSVVVMGRLLKSGAVLDTIELRPALRDRARSFASRAGIEATLEFHLGAALEVLPRLPGPWDLVFIDCVKTEYVDYLDAVLPKLREGAVVVADNVLWKGKVARGERDPETDGIRLFNQRITTDPRLVSAILPIGDGVSVSHYRGESHS